MTIEHSHERYDAIVVGSGIAGLYASLQAHEQGLRILIVTKGTIDEANTRYAQGGIAAAVGAGDSPQSHWRDTMEAGAGLVDAQAAHVLTDEAPDRIADLVRYGVQFDAADGEVSLGREAAHSASRILHAGGDATGFEIEMSLADLARREGVTVIEYALADRIVVRDGVVQGLDVFEWQEGRRIHYDAPAIILATGGVGQMYRFTTNPTVATGDGIALAYRCGAEVMDLEFTQFHPTALRLPGVPTFLISEAVRGEGALLYNTRGERFMPRYHALAELAPRDVVSRAAHREMAETGSDHVLLDVTARDASWLAARFPQIYRTCLDNGLDLSRDRIPVSPAAHYTMGGVRTDTWGQTTIGGLYAIGEVACTGVHGANRLASNSLLETMIFGKRAVQRLIEAPGGRIASTTDARTLPPHHDDVPPPTADDLRALMWSHVGIERDGALLLEAIERLSRWEAAFEASVHGEPNTRADHELRSLLTCARLAADAALLREESRGAHYRTDFPTPRDEWQRHLVYRNGE